MKQLCRNMSFHSTYVLQLQYPGILFIHERLLACHLIFIFYFFAIILLQLNLYTNFFKFQKTKELLHPLYLKGYKKLCKLLVSLKLLCNSSLINTLEYCLFYLILGKNSCNGSDRCADEQNTNNTKRQAMILTICIFRLYYLRIVTFFL